MPRKEQSWMQKYRANVGIYVCGACGKYGPNKATLGDEACFLNSVECWPSSLEFRPNGLVRFAIPCTEYWVEQPLDLSFRHLRLVL